MKRKGTEIFPEIVINEDFSQIRNDDLYNAVQFLKGGNPGYKTKYISYEASNILKYKQLCKVSKLLEEDDFKKFIPIKGMYLLNTLFSEYFGIRPMADIDLLVHPDEFKKLPSFIKKHPDLHWKSNYHPILRRFFGEDLSVVLSNTLIEFHSNIMLVKYSNLIKEIFENTKEITTPDNNTFLVPQIEHAALLMLMHDYSRADLIDLTLRRLLEFYIVIYNCDLNKLKTIARKHDLQRMLDCHLYLIDKMLRQPFFENSFEKHPEFDLIKYESGKAFIVKDKTALRKVLYGKKWKYLRLRNFAAEGFKKLTRI